ncbi:hypothetical protein PAPYR_2111 [Paratrimastix pyriformis]|uniref:Uncharacterized protein n=1 Tax=Paratrimastix pyriformis TaxID=342808 RepID=A0ABQ8UT68_9EUKA|nr:hypothetical protein PAPYR_2111 [Paratrimastix pyriformis]
MFRLSFDLGENVLLTPRVPDSRSLVAILAPCTCLRELELSPSRALTQCGAQESEYLPWVEAAFRHLDSLRALRIPNLAGLAEGAFVAIMGCLPGLEALSLDAKGGLPVDNLLAPIGRSPHLSILELGGGLCLRDYTALRSCRELRQLAAPFGDQLAALVPHLPLLTRLEGLDISSEGQLGPGGPPATALDTLALRIVDDALPFAPFATFLAAHAAHLRKLYLHHMQPLPQLAPLLDQMPALRELSLTGLCPLETDRHLDSLLGRLERLECPVGWRSGDLLLRSTSLRSLTLRVLTPPVGACTLGLACPLLERLDMPRAVQRNPLVLPLSGDLSLELECPMLRELVNLGPATPVALLCPAPRLARVVVDPEPPPPDVPVWLDQLLPGLQELENVHLSDARAFTRVLTSGLRTIRGLAVGMTQWPQETGAVLVGPGLECLEMFAQLRTPHGECLRFEKAPNLRCLRLTISDSTHYHANSPLKQFDLRNCPRLEHLALRVKSFEEIRLTAPLVSLDISFRQTFARTQVNARALVDILRGPCSTTLRAVRLTALPQALRAGWPEILDSLQALPRLEALAIDAPWKPQRPLQLNCPRLRELFVGEGFNSLTLDCPALEDFQTRMSNVVFSSSSPFFVSGVCSKRLSAL